LYLIVESLCFFEQGNNIDDKICRARSGLQYAGLGWAWTLHCGLRLFAGLTAYLVKLVLGLLLNNQKIQACGLCPKPRPMWAWAFGLFSKSPSPWAWARSGPKNLIKKLGSCL
jgi:hypothetical protein